MGLIESISWREEGRGYISPGYPTKADNSPVIVGCGQRKKWKSEKEFEANERLKGQKTKLCKTMTEGEFQQRLEGVTTDLEKGKEPRSLGSRKSQVPRRNKETAVSKAAGVQVR